MASDVSICNQALSWLGGSLITSLDDDINEAKVCKANYADIRDAVLEAHDWTFATPPVNGYVNAFPLPPDVLRVMDFNNGEDWRIEGTAIVTNEAAAKIRAVVRITDPNRFSALFVQALAARLAADLAITLTHSMKLQKQYYAIYSDKMNEAFTNEDHDIQDHRSQAQQLVHRAK